jgi:threo-3-hydroxy-L-aspartate ammonia-lyase
LISLDDVRSAAERLRGVAHRTGVITSRTLDEITRAQNFLKPENLQRGGSFKFRGAYNKMSSLTDDELAAGVATYSSGNHAQAVALAAKMLGTTAVILMPADAPRAKVEATRGYGAEVVIYDRYADDRTALGTQLATSRGLTLVPPYDDESIIAGQGTAALELVEDVGALDALLVPVGGGGLIAGSAVAATTLLPNVRIVGVEPEAGDDTKRSLEKGRRIRRPMPRTIADGQQVEMPGAITFPINLRLVDEVVLVSDEEIVDAMRFAFDYLKLVLEPSGASALAALLARKLGVVSSRVGIILSGGNVGVDRFLGFFSQSAARGAAPRKQDS